MLLREMTTSPVWLLLSLPLLSSQGRGAGGEGGRQLNLESTEAGTNSLVSESDKAGSKKLDNNLISDLLNYSPRQLIFCPAANAIIFCSFFFLPLPPAWLLLGSIIFTDQPSPPIFGGNEAIQGFLVDRFSSHVLCLVQLFAVILLAETLRKSPACSNCSSCQSFIWWLASINNLLHLGAHTYTYIIWDDHIWYCK